MKRISRTWIPAPFSWSSLQVPRRRLDGPDAASPDLLVDDFSGPGVGVGGAGRDGEENPLDEPPGFSHE